MTTERKEDAIIERDTFTHKKYPSVTVTTYRKANGRMGFEIKGENHDELKAVERELLGIVEREGFKVGKRRERTIPREGEVTK